jgi:hypothetical protein
LFEKSVSTPRNKAEKKPCHLSCSAKHGKKHVLTKFVSVLGSFPEFLEFRAQFLKLWQKVASKGAIRWLGRSHRTFDYSAARKKIKTERKDFFAFP